MRGLSVDANREKICRGCKKGVLGEHAQHLLSCNTTSGRLLRHDTVVMELVRCAHAAGINARATRRGREADNVAGAGVASKKTPDGLLFNFKSDTSNHNGTVAFDVQIVHAQANSHVHHHPAASIEAGESTKLKHYMLSPVPTVPAVMSTLGGAGARIRNLLYQFSRHARLTGVEARYFLTRWQRRISIRLLNAVADSLPSHVEAFTCGRRQPLVGDKVSMMHEAARQSRRVARTAGIGEFVPRRAQ
jgi:hypothetical protein